MESTPITRSLSVPGPFWTFNREERNAVAVLFGLLARPGNLGVFAKLFDWDPDDLADAEISVEWTFLRDLWNYHSRRTDPASLRRAIIDALQPPNAVELAECSVLEFNTHFGAVPRPSATYVQSPSNWSVIRFDTTINDDDEFRRTCQFKWAFNVKPDLVVQTQVAARCASKRSGTLARVPIQRRRRRRPSFSGAAFHTCLRRRFSGTS